MDLTDRNEKLAVRGQIFENLRANSRAIWRKLSEIWADQTILQSVHGKSDSLLEAQTGACICCQALFLPLRAASEQFGFEVEAVLADIKAAIHKRPQQGPPEEVSPSESASYEQTENQTD